MTIDRILRVIRKLSAHEQSARKIGSVAEADAFAARIQTLCDRYRVRLADLPPDELSSHIKEEAWAHCDIGQKVKVRVERWLETLAVGVAQGHACQVIGVQGHCIFRFIGAQADAAVARAMFSVLVIAGEMAWTNARRADRRLKRRLFLKGFAAAIRMRYAVRTNERSASSVALVRTLNAAIYQYLSQFKLTKPAKAKPDKYSKSMMLGFYAGQKTSLTAKTMQSAAARLEA